MKETVEKFPLIPVILKIQVPDDILRANNYFRKADHFVI